MKQGRATEVVLPFAIFTFIWGTTWIVIREMPGCSVGPTASDMMLKPRRENRPETRASTPGLSSTSTDRVWRSISPRPP